MLQIQVSELEKSLSLLLEALRKQQGEVIELPQLDLYWAIAPEELYNPYQTPANLTLGQLTDDLEEMGRIANGETRPVSLDFAKLSAILAAIGHKTVW